MTGRYVVTAKALLERPGPDTTGTPRAVRAKGYTFQAVREVEGAGRTWLVTSEGGHLAKEYARPIVASPVPGRKVTTPWGKRPKGWPRRHTYWRARGRHTGDDYAAPRGADVVAVRDGVAEYRWDGVLGHCILLMADDGDTYWYCHLSQHVKDGTRVKAGAKLGEVGDTGTGAQGPHLHFEKRRGHTMSWSGTDRRPTWW